MYAIIFAIIAVVMVLMKKFDKSNITKKIIEESKKVK